MQYFNLFLARYRLLKQQV